MAEAPQNLLQLLKLAAGKAGAQQPKCDLRGAVLTWPTGSSQRCPKAIEIARTGLQLSNGTLQLPPGVRISVSVQQVTFKHVVIKGACEAGGSRQASTDDQAVPGLVTVVAGGSLEMEDCTVELTNSGIGQHVAGVLVRSTPQRPARAQLLRCTIRGCSGDGVCAVHPGSTVHARLCVSSDHGGSGFRALVGGVVGVVSSCAQRNKQSGFGALGMRSRLTTGTNCVSKSNKWGYLANQGGHLTVGDHNTASGNIFSGFETFAGSVVTVGSHCVSENNDQSGFLVMGGGRMQLGDNCVAQNNVYNGFYAKEKDALLQLGDNCSALSNGVSGIYVKLGAVIKAGSGCSSRDNVLNGFAADGAGSRLELGSDCVTGENGAGGFIALGGAHVIVGPGSHDEDGRMDEVGTGSKIRIRHQAAAQGGAPAGSNAAAHRQPATGRVAQAAAPAEVHTAADAFGAAFRATSEPTLAGSSRATVQPAAVPPPPPPPQPRSQPPPPPPLLPQPRPLTQQQPAPAAAAGAGPQPQAQPARAAPPVRVIRVGVRSSTSTTVPPPAAPAPGSTQVPASLPAAPFPVQNPYLPPHLALAFGGRPWAASDPGSLQQQHMPADATGAAAVPLVTAALRELSVRAGARSISYDGRGGGAAPAAAASTISSGTGSKGQTDATSSKPAAAQLTAEQPTVKFECAVCMESVQASRLTAFEPCGHTECCAVCAAQVISQFGECPICREPATGLVWKKPA